MRNILIYACIGLWVLFLTSVIYGCNPLADCNKEYNELRETAEMEQDKAKSDSIMKEAQKVLAGCSEYY